MIWTVPKIWEGGRCFIIGGGPSINQEFGIPADVVADVRSRKLPKSACSEFMAPIHNEHIIGVNDAYQLGDWVDCCFFGDCGWYTVHRMVLAQWQNLKVTCCPRFADRPQTKMEGIKYLAKNRNKKLGLSDNPSKVSWNFNSGSAAMGLARHLGVRQMVLLGFDMKYAPDGATHWHGGHGNRRASYERFLRGFPIIVEDARRLGIEVLNASQDSIIDVFPKVRLMEVL